MPPAPPVIVARYFADRTDGSRVGSLAHRMWAGGIATA
jgi:hypothetical protein